MGPLTRPSGRDKVERLIAEATVPIGTVPIYSMIIGRKIEELARDA